MMTMSRFLRVVSPSLFLVLGFACAVEGQTETATVSGLVTDRTGATVPGAEVRLQSVERGTVTTTTTNGAGIYVFPSVHPGQYQISIQKQGFKQVDLLGLIVNVQDHIEQNFRLEVGSVAESVTVEAAASMINTTDGSVSTVIDQTYVKNMPLNGRSFQDLILLTPGVVTNNPESTTSFNGHNGEFSVNGQRTESNYYTVDGVSANTGIETTTFGPGTSGSVPAATALGTTQSLVSVDALQEFRVQSSTYSAEYGRNPGGQFSFVTRSGTNQWHGSAFDYLRNDLFDANNWFNNYLAKLEPPLRQNDFGATLGGPVNVPGLYNGRDKTFFFFSYEGLRLKQPQAATVNYVPDSALRQATPPPLQQVLNAFSVQNGPEVLNGSGNPTGMAEFIGTWSNPSSLDAYSVRFDHKFNDKLKVFFRFGDTGSSAATRNFSVASGTNPSEVETSRYTSRTYTFGTTSVLSSRLANDFRLNYSSNTGYSNDNLDSFGGAKPINLAQVQQINPSANSSYHVEADLFLAPTAPSGVTPGLTQQIFSGLQRQWNLTDSVSVSFGRHQLKLGVDYRRLTPVQGIGSQQDFYFFAGPTAQNQVTANSPGEVAAVNIAKAYSLYTNFSAFAQDDWRIAPRLNLSMGLRWEVNPAPSVTQGPAPLTVQGINNLSTMALAPPGTSLWKTAWYNFAPRLGAAYVLRNTPGHETVVRGGGGLFFDTGQQTGAYGFESPNYKVQNLFGSLLGAPPRSFPLSPAEAQPAISQNPTPPYSLISGFPPHLQLPYTIQWNMTVEQALGSSQVLSVAAVGSHAGRLLEWRQINISAFNPNFASLVIYQNGATADYDALQVKFKRRISHGLTALASYTYGHSIDYGSSDLSFPYVRGNSDFDVRHNFSSAFSYSPPASFQNRFVRAVLQNWGFDDRFTARTGFPVTLGGGQIPDPVTGTISNAGLDLVQGQPLYLYGANCATAYNQKNSAGQLLGCPGGWAINPNAFTDPNIINPTRLGNAPRNFVRGFGAWQMDFAVRREFPIHETLRLQFRAEAFNIFNHPNFGVINSGYCSLDPNSPSFASPCTFGQATATLNSSLGILSPLYQTGGPRSMQFALKVVF